MPQVKGIGSASQGDKWALHCLAPAEATAAIARHRIEDE